MFQIIISSLKQRWDYFLIFNSKIHQKPENNTSLIQIIDENGDKENMIYHINFILFFFYFLTMICLVDFVYYNYLLKTVLTTAVWEILIRNIGKHHGSWKRSLDVHNMQT